MVLGFTAAAAATGATTATTGGILFDYNRRNFLYDRKMRQETEYQIMNFRIMQAELWREDVRDIIGLTSVKMYTYLVVNAVQLGFCITAFCEGRLAAGTPDWLIGCHALSLAGSFMYLLMSVWFAMYASITAKSCEVRLLTQMVRLPVPSWAELEGARTYSSGYEKVDPRQILRVPFITGTQERFTEVASAIPPHSEHPQSIWRSVAEPTAAACATAAAAARAVGARAGAGAAAAEAAAAAAASAAAAAPDSRRGFAADPWGLERRGDSIYELNGPIRTDPELLRHFCLVREAMQQWQSYDGFSRVAMSIGTNQLIIALAYYVIGYVLVECNSVAAASIAMLLFLSIAAALIRLDMSLTSLEFCTSIILLSTGPILSIYVAYTWSMHAASFQEDIPKIAVPLIYIASSLWLTFVLYISKVVEQPGGSFLPTGFRSVMYIDVFGWIRRTSSQGLGGRAGAGPAVQALRYDGCGRPVPLRPELLEGASVQRNGPVTEEDRQRFHPKSFVPAEKHREMSASSRTMDVPGRGAWKMFRGASVLLIFVWLASGILLWGEALGWSALQVLRVMSLEDAQTEAGPEPLQGIKLPRQRRTPRSSLVASGLGIKSLRDHETTVLGYPSSPFLPSPFGERPEQRLTVSWRRGNGLMRRGRLASLSCAETGAGHVVFLAGSHFGLFTATLELASDTLTLDDAPACEAIEGQLMQDVHLMCTGETISSCSANVLHQQGQSLSSCALAKARKGDTSSIASAWLNDGSQSQEEIRHIALKQCSPNSEGQCAYAETSSRRLVELRSSSGGKHAPHWFPTRVLEGAKSSQLEGGALDIIANRYLAVLDPKLQQLRLIEADNSTVAGFWPLPKDRLWTAFCSTSNSVFLLAANSDEDGMELQRFSMRSEAGTLQSAPQQRSRGRDGREVKGSLERGHLRASRLSRQTPLRADS